MRLPLLFLFLCSLGCHFLNAQDFDELTVRLEKNNYVLYNVETGEKISKLCSAKKSVLNNGTPVVWELNRFIVAKVALKKKEEVFTVYNSQGEMESQFSFIQRVLTNSDFIKPEGSRDFLVEKLPYFLAVSLKGEREYGVYKLNGSELIPPIYNSIQICYLDKDNRLYFEVNHPLNGRGVFFEDKEIIPVKYDRIEPIHLDYYFPVSDYTSEGVYNLTGELIIPLAKHEIVYNQDSTFIINNGGLLSLRDKNGTTVIPSNFSKIKKINAQKYLVDIDGKRGIFDIDSQKIIEYVIIDEAKYEEVDLDSDEIFTIVDQMPVFQGGIEAGKGISQFIADNYRYPPLALDNDIEGKVYVRFVVNTRGKVVDVSIAKGADVLLDKEALRIINALPDFEPGRQLGKRVSVQYIIPINFRIS